MDITSPLKHVIFVFVALAFMGVLIYTYHKGHQDGYDDALENVRIMLMNEFDTPVIKSPEQPIKVRPEGYDPDAPKRVFSE